MAASKVISADSHIVAAGHVYLPDRAQIPRAGPRIEHRKTPNGREYDAWVLDGTQVGTLGAVIQAGQPFEDPSQIDFLGVWEDVRKGAYDPHAMITEKKRMARGALACSRAKACSGIARPTARSGPKSAVSTTTG